MIIKQCLINITSEIILNVYFNNYAYKATFCLGKFISRERSFYTEKMFLVHDSYNNLYISVL